MILWLKNSRLLRERWTRAVRCHCTERCPNSPSSRLLLYWPRPQPSQTSGPSLLLSTSSLTTRFSNKRQRGLVGIHPLTSIFLHLPFSLSHSSKDEWQGHIPMLLKRVYTLSPAVGLMMLWMLCACVWVCFCGYGSAGTDKEECLLYTCLPVGDV